MNLCLEKLILVSQSGKCTSLIGSLRVWVRSSVAELISRDTLCHQRPRQVKGVVGPLKDRRGSADLDVGWSVAVAGRMSNQGACMRSAYAGTRFLLAAALVLSITGCGGCQPTIKIEINTNARDWDAGTRQIVGQIYTQLVGPQVVASAVGAAAPPGVYGPLYSLSTEMAWRQSREREINRPSNATAAAGLIGASAPSGWMGMVILAAMPSPERVGEQFGDRWRLPSLFAADELNRAEAAVQR